MWSDPCPCPHQVAPAAPLSAPVNYLQSTSGGVGLLSTMPLLASRRMTVRLGWQHIALTQFCWHFLNSLPEMAKNNLDLGDIFLGFFWSHLMGCFQPTGFFPALLLFKIFFKKKLWYKYNVIIVSLVKNWLFLVSVDIPFLSCEIIWNCFNLWQTIVLGMVLPLKVAPYFLTCSSCVFHKSLMHGH